MDLDEMHRAQDRAWQTSQRARRDQFAAAALTGLLAYSPAAGGTQIPPQIAAAGAVEYADALLAALDGEGDK